MEMISRIREQLGPAGFVIAIVALVAALGGGAYAASGGLTGTQKKQVKKIAQTEAKKVQGTGPKGDPGAPGANGKDGANGTNGKDGTSGTNGKSVVTGTEPTGTANCGELGGSWVEAEGSGAKKYACNGEEGPEGSPWTAGSTLPSEATETGTWYINGTSAHEVVSPISFPIQLSNADTDAITIHFWRAGNTADTNCTGTAEAPKAKPGTLCVYLNEAVSGITQFPVIFAPGPEFESENEVGTSGAWLYYEQLAGAQNVGGSFAVTAP